MNKAEIAIKFMALNKKSNDLLNESGKTLTHDIINYETYIKKVHEKLVMTLAYSIIHKSEIFKEYPEASEIVMGWINKVKHLSSYNPLNLFVAIRIYWRKMIAIETKYNLLGNRLLETQKELDDFLDMIDGEKGYLIEDFDLKATNLIYALGIMRNEIKFKNDTFNDLIHTWFSFFSMDKNDFLSLISLNHRKFTWDGYENKTFEVIKNLPENITQESFENAVFVEIIEKDDDSYLFDQFLEAFMQRMDQDKEFEEKTRTIMRDTFGIDFSQVVAKPNLRLV